MKKHSAYILCICFQNTRQCKRFRGYLCLTFFNTTRVFKICNFGAEKASATSHDGLRCRIHPIISITYSPYCAKGVRINTAIDPAICCPPLSATPISLMRTRILVIDDEEALCEILKYNLEKEGYEVDTAYSAEEALEMDLTVYSLLIVDIMMERLSGFDFAKQIRWDGSPTESIPIIFCSALNGEDDTVMGLNIGADDYITKPFVISEVLARVRAVLRRSMAFRPVAAPQEKDIYEPDIVFKDLRIDQNEKLCFLGDQELALTKTEFDLLQFFLSHRNRIYSREEIIQQVWAKDMVVTNRAIDTNIARLRKKIGEYGNNIVTRLGFGYGFKETN